MRTLKAEPLTREGFAGFGDVIESVCRQDNNAPMNAARFERFNDLCGIDVANDGDVAISIARCRIPTTLPLVVSEVERHPLGSQAFVPLSPCQMLVVVAPPRASLDEGELRAFVSNGRQGINYRLGTWHMPLVGFDAGQEFLIIDRAGDEPNCEMRTLDEAVQVEL